MTNEVKLYSCKYCIMYAKNGEYVAKEDYLAVVAKLKELESNAFSAVDMATAASSGFTDGVASRGRVGYQMG